MLGNRRHIPLGSSKSLAKDYENLPADINFRDRRLNYNDKKSYSLSYEVPKEDATQNSPHFLNAMSSSRTDKGAIDLHLSLRESRAELERKAAKVENEIAMRHEVRRMKEIMHEEQQKKLNELEETVNEYWEAKISKLHRNYQMQLNDIEKTTSGRVRTSPREDLNDIARKIEEKHYREYVHKIDDIKQHFKKIDDENKMEIRKEIAKELEPRYKEQLSEKMMHVSQEMDQNIQRENRSKTKENRLKLRSQASLERSLMKKSKAGNHPEIAMAQEAEKIEEVLRREYEEDLENMKRKYEDNEKELWKVFSKAEIREREKKRRELEERMNRDLTMKERSLEIQFKRKLEEQQTALKRSFEVEVENHIKNEKKSLDEEKGQIGRLKSLSNVRMNKIEEAKRGFYEKMKQQENKLSKKADSLQKELDILKHDRQQRANSPNLGQLRAEYLSKVQDQGEAALTTTKWQKSLRDQGKENKNRSATTSHSQSFTALKPPLSDSMNEKVRSNQRRKSFVATEETKANGHLSLSQNTVRDTDQVNTSKEYQNPKYYFQQSFREGTQESSAPYNRCLNSKIRNIEAVSKRDDSNRAIKGILDASQPPELLFSTKNDSVPILPSKPKEERYRKPSDEVRANTSDTLTSYDNSTRRRSLIKNDSMVQYDKLKAEIMRKYEPGHERNISGDMSFMDGMIPQSPEKTKRGRKSPDTILERAQLDDQKRKEFMEKYDRSLKKLERTSITKKHKQYTDSGSKLINSRSTYGNPEEKYREIVDKYLEKSVSKKYEIAEKMKKSSGYGGFNNKYQELFRVDEDDNAQTKSMKRFKKVIEAAIEKDNNLEAKYLAREIFFLTDFITGLDNESKYMKETLRRKLKDLYEGWNATETSYEARLRFLGELDLMLNLEDVIRKTDVETEYLNQYKQEVGEIVGLFKERNKLKKKVDIQNFEYSLCKGTYASIEEIMGRMKVLLQDYHRMRKKEIVYKGIDLSDIIKVDMWEHEYLNEVEEREVLWKRVKHRH